MQMRACSIVAVTVLLASIASGKKKCRLFLATSDSLSATCTVVEFHY